MKIAVAGVGVAAVGFACVALVLGLSGGTGAQEGEGKGPSILKLPVEGVVAQIAFEKGVKVSVTSKGTPLKPGEYFVQSLSLFKTDDRKRSWELRSTGKFGSLANVTLSAGQEKILLLGKPIVLHVETSSVVKQGTSDVVFVTVSARGQSGEGYYPGGWLGGKQFTPPTVAIKDAGGKTLAGGPAVMTDDHHARFDWKFPKDFHGAFDVDVRAVMGPFEFTLTKYIRPIP